MSECSGCLLLARPVHDPQPTSIPIPSQHTPWPRGHGPLTQDRPPSCKRTGSHSSACPCASRGRIASPSWSWCLGCEGLLALWDVYMAEANLIARPMSSFQVARSPDSRFEQGRRGRRRRPRGTLAKLPACPASTHEARLPRLLRPSAQRASVAAAMPDIEVAGTAPL